ncbi:MAG: winged helix-turn-helix transcriptional regulator [Rhodospirillales bacterium]
MDDSVRDGAPTVQGCPLDRVLQLLSGEWTPHILWALATHGPTRHGALRRRVAGISAKVLTERLRMLEAEGLVYRDVVATVPPQVTYGLTELGRSLDVSLQGMDHLAGRIGS